MRTLMLMRHAKSDWSQPGLSDYERPLNARGRRTAPMMAEQLQREGFSADIILASSAVRVQETVQLLQHRWSTETEVLSEQALYLASPQELIDQIHSLHDDWQNALLVGHNPGLCALACHLAEDNLEMPTAAIAIFQSETPVWRNSIAATDWSLAAHWKPKELNLG